MRHLNTKAVLWPVWRVRGVWEVKAKQVMGKGARGKVWFAVREGSVPGESFLEGAERATTGASSERSEKALQATRRQEANHLTDYLPSAAYAA